MTPPIRHCGKGEITETIETSVISRLWKEGERNEWMELRGCLCNNTIIVDT
jgi:hypothetical protein